MFVSHVALTADHVVIAAVMLVSYVTTEMFVSHVALTADLAVTAVAMLV
jgi:hypothetical protein